MVEMGEVWQLEYIVRGEGSCCPVASCEECVVAHLRYMNHVAGCRSSIIYAYAIKELKLAKFKELLGED